MICAVTGGGNYVFGVRKPCVENCIVRALCLRLARLTAHLSLCLESYNV